MNKKKLKKKDIAKDINLVVRFKPRNSILSITRQPKGHVIFWESGGTCGFKGSRKKTTASLFTISETIGKKIRDLLGCFALDIIVYGKANLKRIAKGLSYRGIVVNSFLDNTSIPHNGVSFSKKRRKKKRTRRRRHYRFKRLITGIQKDFTKTRLIRTSNLL
jgi:small subunit ribosomal protein S11